MTFEGGTRVDHLFDEALRHPTPGFALGQRLAALYPERYMIEGSGWFDVRSFARAGKCTVEPREGLYHQIDSAWSPDHGIYRSPATAWLVVTWEGSRFDLVVIQWPGFVHPHQHHVILAPDQARGDAFFEAVSRWNHEVRGEILVFADGCFSKSTELYAAVKAASFDQLVLEGSFKEQIRDDFTQFLASRATYEEAGVPWRRGALFIGPPGNGKTLCVKAVVHELGIPCLYIQSFEARHSTAQRAIDTVFDRARAQAPCIIVLEDIDALLTDGARSFFLNELDGFAQNTGVITLATTNHPERLDPSIVERPSRFDRKYHFELPSAPTRAAYIGAWNERLRPPLRLSDAGRAQVVDLTHGFSFAYIQEVFVSSMMHWMQKRDSVGILPVALEQIELLRDQMTRATG